MRTFDEMESLWRGSTAPPIDSGSVKLIVLRRGGDRHDTPDAAELSVEHGLVGDRWREADDFVRQLTLMNVRAAEIVTGDDQPLHMPGDNFLVDLDLSDGNLPPGSRVQIGEAVIEVTEMPHTGCKKFAARFGQDAMRWVNWKEHRDRRLRGINSRVVKEGSVAVGDSCQVLARGAS